MANPLWKKIEQSRPYWRVKLLVKRLQGRELWLSPQIKVQTIAYDDWEIATGDLDPNSIVYSLGVGDDIEFDLAIIQQFGCNVFAFDPTPTSATFLTSKNPPPTFKFHQWAIAAQDGTLTLYPRVKKDGTLSDMMFTLAPETASRDHGVEVPAYRIASLMTKLGHTQIDVLKMDIEGASTKCWKDYSMHRISQSSYSSSFITAFPASVSAKPQTSFPGCSSPVTESLPSPGRGGRCPSCTSRRTPPLKLQSGTGYVSDDVTA